METSVTNDALYPQQKEQYHNWKYNEEIVKEYQRWKAGYNLGYLKLK